MINLSSQVMILKPLTFHTISLLYTKTCACLLNNYS